MPKRLVVLVLVVVVLLLTFLRMVGRDAGRVVVKPIGDPREMPLVGSSPFVGVLGLALLFGRPGAAVGMVLGVLGSVGASDTGGDPSPSWRCSLWFQSLRMGGGAQEVRGVTYQVLRPLSFVSVRGAQLSGALYLHGGRLGGRAVVRRGLGRHSHDWGWETG